MDDLTLLGLCIFDEAAGERYEGKVAVAHVVLNRMARKYSSDGTVAGTVLAKDQFSGFWFDMIDGQYKRVCTTLAQAQARADAILDRAQAAPVWEKCLNAARDARGGVFQGSPDFEALVAAGLSAVLYCNPAISTPAWAKPSALVATIQHHAFYRG